MAMQWALAKTQFNAWSNRYATPANGQWMQSCDFQSGTWVFILDVILSTDSNIFFMNDCPIYVKMTTYGTAN